MSQGKNHSTATTALILGAFSLVCCGPFTGIPAIVLGVIARGEIDKSNGELVGRERATAAIILGAIGTILITTIGAFAPRSPRVERDSDPTPSHQSSPLAKARVECTPSGPASMNCKVTSEGVGKAVLCWDVVLTCDGVRHVGHACSGVLPSGSVETVSVRSFSPSLSGSETCDSVRVESTTLELRLRVFRRFWHTADPLQQRAIRKRNPELRRERERRER